MSHDIYVAEIPSCPTHGQMQPGVFLGMDGGDGIALASTYTCAGYDGEGCDYTAPVEYRIIGTVEHIDFGWGLRDGYGQGQ